MKKLKSLLRYFLLAGVLIFTSCDDDDKEAKIEFPSGVFVVNEGNFTEADGTVSHFNWDNGDVTQDLFGTANNKEALGSVVQSMTIDNDLAYIVVNNSNKVEVVNATTFVSEYTLDGLALPRQFITYNGKGYLTEWVGFTDPGRVAVINLESHAIETTITTESGAENIIASNGKLYVSNNFTNTVSVINPSTNQVIETIEVASAPGAFAIDKDNKLWVVCGGAYQGNDGAFYRINTTTDEVEESIELNVNVDSKMVINKSKDRIYFYKGKNIYELPVTATEAPAEPFITENGAVGFYGIGFDTEHEIIYAADSKAFAGNGTVYRYSKNGTAIDNFTAGRGPNGFVFR